MKETKRVYSLVDASIELGRGCTVRPVPGGYDCEREVPDEPAKVELEEFPVRPDEKGDMRGRCERDGTEWLLSTLISDKRFWDFHYRRDSQDVYCRQADLLWDRDRSEFATRQGFSRDSRAWNHFEPAQKYIVGVRFVKEDK